MMFKKEYIYVFFLDFWMENIVYKKKIVWYLNQNELYKLQGKIIKYNQINMDIL